MYEMLYLPPLNGSTISTILVHTLETKTGLTLLLVLSILVPNKKINSRNLCFLAYAFSALTIVYVGSTEIHLPLF